MEEFLFRLPEVSRKLESLVEARLHTDGHGAHEPISKRNRELQGRLTGTVATPIYLIVDPVSGETLGIFEGATQDPGVFLDWLAEVE